MGKKELSPSDLRHLFCLGFPFSVIIGVDSRSGHVFCFQCQDYIYDPSLEDIRIERESSIDGGGVFFPPPILPFYLPCERANDGIRILTGPSPEEAAA